jgi:hypothetical protein
MKRALILIGLFLVGAAMLSAADITGTWKGSFQFNGNDVPVTLNLKNGGESVTGTVEGLPTSPTDIKDGKLEGDAVSFWIMIDYEGNPVKLVYKGKVTGDEIQFSFGTEDGSWGTDLKVKRAS